MCLVACVQRRTLSSPFVRPEMKPGVPEHHTFPTPPLPSSLVGTNDHTSLQSLETLVPGGDTIRPDDRALVVTSPFSPLSSTASVGVYGTARRKGWTWTRTQR